MGGHNEVARLASLKNLRLLDTLPSESFDRITRLVAHFFDLPIAAVSLTDIDRQWFKSSVGVEHNQIPREKAPCAQVAESCKPLVIHDFQEDEFYRDSTLGNAGIRFYAGTPLITPDGHGLGALCVLGTEPRSITESELKTLTDLAAMVMDQIELQHAVGRIEASSGLPNRFQLINDLSDLHLQSDGTPRLMGLLDLAHTAQFDRLSRALTPGHLDGIIQSVVRILNEHVGAATTPYHIGPTQFAFFAPNEGAVEEYSAEISRILREIERSREFPMTITPSVGILNFNPAEMEPEDVFRSLQSAVQDARDSHTGIALFSTLTDQRHRRNFTLLQDFPRALEADDQLYLVFQPRMDVTSGEVRAAEALLRWKHPTLGNISPAEFIPLVEASTFARELTDWVIDQSLKVMGQWRRQGHALQLSINLSAANLEEPDFLERFLAALDRHHAKPGDIELELTESAMMKEADRALDLLERLSEAGAKLAIDDFGTGYSSLSYMQKLPADVVKIDRSFIADLVNGNRERVLVRSMIDLSHSLGYRVVAEGVETLEMSDMLEAMGCDEIQGFWLSRPLSGDMLIDWIRFKASSLRQMRA
ncbi:sensor domain-containing phosphodiesterase [Rhizobium paknamense]|uniref:EAL domain-containing protein (Putative c-di-GMP-specific phosphodiesterase class I)/GGDEF domain-containing protein n=1 Tax=Rhizobium paknamense TaxID=1206817 RepID=A0ABU0II04_9HYPH|nr:sensor domain-containing phosphodiesterase [Rhizobium paknamense]MDQ0457811.1 EAL domain-containing protein (putative c-di-GMP-specific phosphodiesterase class I)/GGDEF domain-containing protein [Rhizobium paknamense]